MHAMKTYELAARYGILWYIFHVLNERQAFDFVKLSWILLHYY